MYLAAKPAPSLRQAFGLPTSNKERAILKCCMSKGSTYINVRWALLVVMRQVPSTSCELGSLRMAWLSYNYITSTLVDLTPIQIISCHV
jgi:hypothetical protein